MDMLGTKARNSRITHPRFLVCHVTVSFVSRITTIEAIRRSSCCVEGWPLHSRHFGTIDNAFRILRPFRQQGIRKLTAMCPAIVPRGVQLAALSEASRHL